MRSTKTSVSPDVVLSDISNNQYFTDQYMYSVRYHASQLLKYKNEASITAREHMKWVGQGLWQGVGKNDYYEYYMLIDLHNGDTYALIESMRYYTAESREESEQAAIRIQLDAFRSAHIYLNSTEGLIYYISDPAGTLIASSGIETLDAGLFKSQPVYYIRDGSQPSVASYVTSREYAYSDSTEVIYEKNSIVDKSAIYLAFTADVVNARNIEYAQARTGYVRDFTIITIAALLIVALLVILFLGAGKKLAAAGTIHFVPTDKPYLDIGFLILAGWIVIAVTIAGQFFVPIWHHKNIAALNTLFAIVSAVIVSPALLWLMNLAKRVKAGRFWQYTLIYSLPRWFFRFFVRLFKSLWAGFPLMAKAGVITFISFCCMLLIGFAGYASRGNLILIFSFVFCAVTAFFLLRYARRIRKLERGARDVSGGSYGKPIDAGGGELGRIAGSINDIAAGINTAVEQRMKSDRLKTELITNVSHDIRTPLTSIITYTDLLKNEGLDCEKAPEYLDILIQKSHRLKTLTDELFEASKAATGNIEVNISQLDIVSLINQVLGELDGAIKSSGLDLRVNLPENLPVMADGRLMWRVMENLLSNVFKYSLPGSRVYLDAAAAKQEDGARTSHDAGELPPRFARIDLKNISAAELNVDPAELTERFKRGDDSRTEGGSGLGLSIVQSFVSAQGGRFTISIDGDLFKASVYLPIKQD